MDANKRRLWGGEAIRAIILGSWALWLGLFARFEDPDAQISFEFFADLADEWVWAAAFLAVAGFSLAATLRNSHAGRVAGGATIAISWGYVAAGFASVNWQSTAVPVTALLSFYSVYGLLMLDRENV